MLFLPSLPNNQIQKTGPHISLTPDPLPPASDLERSKDRDAATSCQEAIHPPMHRMTPEGFHDPQRLHGSTAKSSSLGVGMYHSGWMAMGSHRVARFSVICSVIRVHTRSHLSAASGFTSL
jgi:hypothetical protein